MKGDWVMRGKLWTENENEILKNNYRKKSTKEIHEYLQTRTLLAIRMQAFKLGLQDIDKKWTEKEKELLKKYYETESFSWNLFPERTRQSIISQASKLRLKKIRAKCSNEWKTHEINLLKDKYRVTGAIGLAKILSTRTVPAIKHKARELGIQTDRSISQKKYTIDETCFDNFNQHSVYFMGLIAADGCIFNNNNLRISLWEKDIGILYRFQDFLHTNVPIRYLPTIPNQMASIGLTSTKIAERLKKLGITERKVHSLKYPNIPKKYDRDFIRGLSDGDGSFFISNSYRSLHWNLTGTESILNSVLLKFKENGLKTHTTVCKSSPSKTSYSLIFYARKAEFVARYLYMDATIYLPRKFKVAEPFLNLNQFDLFD